MPGSAAREYCVHLDGSGSSIRKALFFSETSFHGPRLGQWKFLFTEQNQRTTPLIARFSGSIEDRPSRRTSFEIDLDAIMSALTEPNAR